MKRCSTCRWWKDARLTAQMVDIETDESGYVTAMGKLLGYCEVCVHLGGNVYEWSNMKGLTAEDYVCGEWSESDD